MSRYVLVILVGLALLGGCRKRMEPITGPPQAVEPPKSAAKTDPVARGNEIFSGLDYSSTALSCAQCHAPNVATETGHLFVAHSAYGMAARGTWWILTPEEFSSKQGEARTLAEAANRCIKAPYMNGTTELSAEDAAALEAFLASIADPQAKDGKPFLIQRATKPPVGGLKPDQASGKRIYETSCLHCHSGMPNIPKLDGIGAKYNALQLMAKVRGLADWKEGYASKEYALGSNRLALALLSAAGISAASAQQPPATGAGAAAEPDGLKIPQAFPLNAMPGYALDLLSDQNVVDVAYYLAEELQAAPGTEPEGAPESPAGN